MNYSQITSESLEDCLTAAYEQQALRYQAASTVATEIAENMSLGEVDDSLQAKLQVIMDEISAADRGVDPIRKEWDKSGRDANDALRNAVERLREMIGSVMETIAKAEANALEEKAKLAPHIGTAMTARRMVTAYDSARSGS